MVLEIVEVECKFVLEIIDVMLLGCFVKVGMYYLLISVVEEVEDLFLGMGYEVVEGLEVEQDYYNFEVLNLLKGYLVCDM